MTKIITRKCINKFTFTPIFILLKKNIKTMAIKITEDCINCGACEPECPMVPYMPMAMNGDSLIKHL